MPKYKIETELQIASYFSEVNNVSLLLYQIPPRKLNQLNINKRQKNNNKDKDNNEKKIKEDRLFRLKFL